MLDEIYNNLREIAEEEEVQTTKLETLISPGESFCSALYKAKVILKNEIQPTSLIIKIISKNVFKDFLADQFRTECYMYRTSLPEVFPNELDLFPRVHVLKDNILILDDVSAVGYKMGPKNNLDVHHLELAIKGLGRLHAASLAFKIQNPKRFYEIGTKLYNIIPILKRLQKGREVLGSESVRLYLEKYPEKVNDPGVGNLKYVFENLTDPIGNSCGEKEPWMVLCHGDFNRNNMLFKYDIQGKPIGVKFIDLQTSRIGSPVVDLSVIFWVNTNQKTRQDYQGYLIDIYFSIIEKKIRYLDTERIYTREMFDKEFNARAFYGYMIGCDFIRICIESAEVMKNVKINLDEDYWELIKGLGGKEADERIIDLVGHFMEKKYWPVSEIKIS